MHLSSNQPNTLSPATTEECPRTLTKYLIYTGHVIQNINSSAILPTALQPERGPYQTDTRRHCTFWQDSLTLREDVSAAAQPDSAATQPEL